MPFPYSCLYIIPKEAHQRQSDWSSVAPTGRRCKHCACEEPSPRIYSFLRGLRRSATSEAHLRKWEFGKAKHLKIEKISTNISLRIFRDETGSRPQSWKSPIPAGAWSFSLSKHWGSNEDARMRGGCAGKHWEALQRWATYPPAPSGRFHQGGCEQTSVLTTRV